MVVLLHAPSERAGSRSGSERGAPSRFRCGARPLYRALFRMLSAQTLVATGLKHFSRIYDTGSVAATEELDGSMRVRWSGCTGFDRNMWVEILGACERLGELAGAKRPHGTIEEGGDGESCVAVFRLR